jgi:transposase-like protein
MLKQFNTLQELMATFRHPNSAPNYFRRLRWPNGIVCPYCGHDEIYRMTKRRGFRCSACKKDFSVVTGTIFEQTKLPLKLWFGAIWLLTNHPKGIASTTLAKDLGITQKTAWFMLHRLRHAARTKSFNARTKLGGKVEVDETYVGGKSINRHGRRSGTGGGHRGKTPVVGAVERKGDVVVRVLDVASQPELQGFVHDVVSPRAKLLATDAHPAYATLLGFPQHEVVNHNKGEWRKGDAHTNTIEGVWAQLKRQISGTHHWVSPKHLQKYVDEMAWRMNRRSLTAAERVNVLLSDMEGRLTFRRLVA